MNGKLTSRMTEVRGGTAVSKLLKQVCQTKRSSLGSVIIVSGRIH